MGTCEHLNVNAKKKGILILRSMWFLHPQNVLTLKNPLIKMKEEKYKSETLILLSITVMLSKKTLNHDRDKYTIGINSSFII